MAEFIKERRRYHTITFDDPERTRLAVRRLLEEGFDVYDVYAPFPIHGMEDEIGLRETQIPRATFIGGAIGGVLGLGFQIWTHAISWPLNIGGKSDLALPALIPVTFEVVVLIAAFATVGTLLFRSRLWPRPPNQLPPMPDGHVTDNEFVISVIERDASFSPEQFRKLCDTFDATNVREDWRVL